MVASIRACVHRRGTVRDWHEHDTLNSTQPIAVAEPSLADRIHHLAQGRTWTIANSFAAKGRTQPCPSVLPALNEEEDRRLGGGVFSRPFNRHLLGGLVTRSPPRFVLGTPAAR